MTTPAKLSGAATSVTIDGNDLHEYGVVVLNVDNPTPQAKESVIEIPQKDGSFDFTGNYGTREMTISGKIIADTHTQLLSNIDLLKKLLRLKKNKKPFEVIFQDQSDRYWTCRYSGGIDISYNALWKIAKTASFNLPLICTKPYAEKTSLTTVTQFVHIFRRKEIDYSGTYPTPIALRLYTRFYKNIVEQARGDFSESNDSGEWNYGSNCAIAKTDAGDVMYGTYKIRLTQSAGGQYYGGCTIEADGSFEFIDKTKYYVACGYIYIGEGITYMRAGTDIGLMTSNVIQVTSARWYKVWAKVQPSDMTGASWFRLYFWHDGTASQLDIDGVMLCEITQTEYDDSDYIPPPYQTDPTGDDFIPPKDPIIYLHSSYNVYPYKNGEGFDNWQLPITWLSECVDPFGEEGIILQHSSDSASNSFSPKIFIEPFQYYQISFKFFIPVLESGGTVKFIIRELSETIEGTSLKDSEDSQTKNTEWGSYEKQILSTECSHTLHFIINTAAGTETVVYIKDVMIEKQPNQYQDFSDYKEPDKKFIAYTGTLEQFDEVIINTDRMTASLHDWSAHDVLNAIGNTDINRLILSPGKNELRYSDDRGENGGMGSCGGMYVDITYRERYL